jgi:heme/copper-type cytochrome/quinol oxidase subunit 4
MRGATRLGFLLGGTLQRHCFLHMNKRKKGWLKLPNKVLST